MLRKKTFVPEFCSLISNWFDMREQAPGAKLLHDSVSGASSLVCTEICFAGACFRCKLPRVYWLGYLPGSVFRERVSGASSLVCTGLKFFFCRGEKCGVRHVALPALMMRTVCKLVRATTSTPLVCVGSCSYTANSPAANNFHSLSRLHNPPRRPIPSFWMFTDTIRFPVVHAVYISCKSITWIDSNLFGICSFQKLSWSLENPLSR